MNVPNLDKLDEKDLWAFWRRYQNAPKRAEQEALVGSRKGYTVLAAKLGAYAANRATYLACVRQKEHRAADIYAYICESIYSELPPDLKFRA